MKIRWALIGAGIIANKRVGPALAAEPRSELAAVVDSDPRKAETLCRAFGCGRPVANFEQVLADTSIDAVYLATPVYLHAQQALAALKAGKNVICEKPLALNASEAMEVARAAKKIPAKAATAYFRRFTMKYRHAMELLKKGAFGRVILIRICYHTWTEISPDSPIAWRTDRSLAGGGVLADMGSHMFDVMIGLFGLPAKVFAKVRTLTFPYKTEDSAAMVMEYENGCLVTASFNWNSKTWSHEFEIIGTEAKLRWHPFDGDKAVWIAGKEIKELDLPNHPNVHYPLIEDFVSAILEDKQPAVPMDEAVKTNLLLDAIFRSSESGKEIDISRTIP